MEKMIDMHIHSCYSDGEYSPDKLVELAIRNNIGVMALTDHDTLEGVKRIKHDSKDIEVFKGIEMSAKRSHGKMHILGYQIDIEDASLNNTLNNLRDDRLEFILRMFRQLELDYGIRFLYEDMSDLILQNRNISRVDIARLCVDYGYTETIAEAYKKYLNDAKKKVMDSVYELSASECLELIKESGGVAVLAHPKTLHLDEDDLIWELDKLVNQGLDGIEVWHSSHSEKQKELYLRIAEKYNLLVSGGSDFHGPLIKPNIQIGTGKNNNLKIKQLTLVDYLRNR